VTVQPIVLLYSAQLCHIWTQADVVSCWCRYDHLFDKRSLLATNPG